ncbi:uncharacterized protein LOC118494390 [Sander lucioperca]|uniref:uncharacterized protein LOC118494390 n=1 Tax=Sander lucioperca TaxID=283035 RepID=UPI00165391A9|nr:uncharacterized protein LOC118494390 [Sander lucioperca]
MLNHGKLPQNHQLFQLDPVMQDGVLRVGGRLKKACLPHDLKHPVILPRDGVITSLIIGYCHEKGQHQGRGQTLNELRAHGYWVVGGSKIVASYIKQCVTCRRARRPTETQKMADLPANRVDPSPPFSFCGMDCFGPFLTKQVRKEHKRSVLSCVLSKSAGRLDDASLRTFFYEAMSIVNSRPLTTDSINDSKSLEPLTPNHLLTMKSSVPLPPPGKFVAEDVYAKKRWRRVQYLTEQFWSRWKKEYLTNIILRQRWHSARRNVKVGDIVIVKEDEVPRNEWRIGRVLDVCKDEDGLVRKVTVQMGNRKLRKEGQRLTSSSILERPVHKLVVLVENN